MWGLIVSEKCSSIGPGSQNTVCVCVSLLWAGGAEMRKSQEGEQQLAGMPGMPDPLLLSSTYCPAPASPLFKYPGPYLAGSCH